MKKDKDIFFKEKEKKSNKFRSEILNIAINTEFLISKILINFLGETKEVKETLEKYLFSDTLTFEKKNNLFNSLHKKELFINTTDSVRSDLDYFKKIRNYMAHSKVAIDYRDVNNLDRNNLLFLSYTERNGEVEIRINIDNDKEDLKNNIYSNLELLKRKNNLNKILGEIYNDLVNC